MENGLEAPETDVTTLVEERNVFVDCWSDVLPSKKSGPIATSKYNTLCPFHSLFLSSFLIVQFSVTTPVSTMSIGTRQRKGSGSVSGSITLRLVMLRTIMLSVSLSKELAKGGKSS